MLNVKANPIYTKPIKYSPSTISQIPNPTSNKDNTIEIFDNSFKYAFTNTIPHPTITLCITEQADNYLILEYKDNGQGISGISSDKLFDAFSTDALTSGGLGIGLNMASNIMVSILDSEILLTEAENGVCFRLLFKLNQNLDK